MVVIIIILGVGMIFGSINGILVSRLKFPIFIATLGTAMLSRLGFNIFRTKTISFPQGSREGAFGLEKYLWLTGKDGLFPRTFPTDLFC